MRQMLLTLSVIQPHTQYFEFMKNLAGPCGSLPEEVTLLKAKSAIFLPYLCLLTLSQSWHMMENQIFHKFKVLCVRLNNAKR